MKKVVIFPDVYLDECSEVLVKKEPFYLHGILFLIFAVLVFCVIFIIFGKMDDVQGIVRPEKNVSTVKNIISGNIEDIFYKPGQYVFAGEKLLCIDGRKMYAQKEVLISEQNDLKVKKTGLEEIIFSFENGLPFVKTKNPSISARYAAFIAEKNLLIARAERCEKMYEQEKLLPESLATKSSIEELEYEYKNSVLELENCSTSFLSSIKAEYENISFSLKECEQNIVQLSTELENLVLLSPIDGFVQEISSLNKGDYIFLDQKVLNIVPSDSISCRVELQIPADRIGKVKEGQKVLLRFTAFPFYEFAEKQGVLATIQPDSQVSENGKLFYSAYVLLDSLSLKSRKNVEYQIKSGLEVNARIVLETQTLLCFLLKKLDLSNV